MRALWLTSLFLLALSCGEVKVNTTPYTLGDADYYWNKDVLLTGNEQEKVMMYGVRFTLWDFKPAFCSGYNAKMCLGSELLEKIIGE